MESEIKCSNKKHSEINAIRFCPECNTYLCNKCLNYHSELHEDHKVYNIDTKIQDIFTGICKESNHKAPLEFYCKSHNKLCCSSCLSKLKGKESGQHSNCEVCLIEEIKEEKKVKLNENLKYMEDIGKKIEELINELKNIFKNISESKEAIKLKIAKVFTNIRNVINNREDELLLEVDNIYNKIYFKEDLIKKGEKIPNQIKLYKEKGELLNKDWENDNKLNNVINDCITIENNINNIKEINESIIKYKSEINTIKFLPEEDNLINEFLGKIKNFGEIINEEESNFHFKFKEGNNYIISNNGLVATKNKGDDDWNCVFVGDREIPKNRISKWKIKINTDVRYNCTYDLFVGIGPNQFNGILFDECWSICKNGTEGVCFYMQKQFIAFKNYKNKIKKDDIIEVIVDRKLGNLSFCVNDFNCGIVWTAIPKEESLYPTIVLYEQNHSIELV